MIILALGVQAGYWGTGWIFPMMMFSMAYSTISVLPVIRLGMANLSLTLPLKGAVPVYGDMSRGTRKSSDQMFVREVGRHWN